MSEQQIILNARGPLPPLMVIPRKRLSLSSIENIRSAYEQYDPARQILVLEDMDVFQLIDGRWEALKISPPDSTPA